jgi:acetyl-CoA acetyltransferase
MVKVTTKKRGETFKSIREAADKTGIPYMTLYMRVNKLGWSIGRAIHTEVRAYGKTKPYQAA